MQMGMLLLQSHDKYDELALFDPITGYLALHSKGATPVLSSLPPRGHFSKVDHHMVILYRDDDSLHLRVDKSDVVLDQRCTASLLRGDRQVLTIQRDGNTILSLDYARPAIDPPLDMDPTWTEEQDFDFGLFVYNVLKNADRRARIYTAVS